MIYNDVLNVLDLLHQRIFFSFMLCPVAKASVAKMTASGVINIKILFSLLMMHLNGA